MGDNGGSCIWRNIDPSGDIGNALCYERLPQTKKADKFIEYTRKESAKTKKEKKRTENKNEQNEL